MSTIPADISSDVLNSWKEIARYLDRGVRTVQRWEAELNLPVRRPRKGRSPVIALRSEIDLWLKATVQGKQNGNGVGSFDVLRAESRDLRLASQQLRGDVSRLRKELSLTVSALVATLQKMAPRSADLTPER